MTTDPGPIDDLRRLDRPIAPPPEADRRVRRQLLDQLAQGHASAEHLDTSSSRGTSEREYDDPTVVDIDVVHQRERRDRRRWLLPSIAAALASIALFVSLNSGTPQLDPGVAPAIDEDDRCTTLLATYGDAYRDYFDSVRNATTHTTDLEALASAQDAALGAVRRWPELSAEDRELVDRVTSALDDFEGARNDPARTDAVGRGHLALTTLLEGLPPSLGCDVTALPWPLDA